MQSARARESNEGIQAHVILNIQYTAELFDTSLHLTKGKERIVQLITDRSGT